MGARVSVKIEGGEELVKKLKRMGVDVGRVLESAATAGAEIIAQDASGRAPRPLIRTETAERKGNSATVDIGPLDEVWYWRYLETGAQAHTIQGNPLVFEGEAGLVVAWSVGHPGMAARPFLRPAFDGKQGQATDEFGNTIKKRVLD